MYDKFSEIHEKNETFLCKVVKKEKETSASFIFTCQIVKVMSANIHITFITVHHCNCLILLSVAINLFAPNL